MLDAMLQGKAETCMVMAYKWWWNPVSSWSPKARVYEKRGEILCELNSDSKGWVKEEKQQENQKYKPSLLEAKTPGEESG